MRYVVAIGGLVVLIGLLVAIKFTQISGLMKMGKDMQAAGPPPEVVGTAVATEATWEDTVASVGTVSALKGVQVSNDAAGVVTAIRFDSGAIVKQGDILVELDSNVERAQMSALQARRELANTNAGRTRALVASNSIAKSQLDNDEALVKSSASDLSALQAQIARKVVRAPFSGKLGIRQINLGQYLNPGTNITTLESLDGLFVDFNLPQQSLSDVAVGSTIHVSFEDDGSGDAGAPIDGTVKAVDPAIDPITRTIKVRAAVPENVSAKLRSGMFANVELVLPKQRKYTIMPITGVTHASFGDSIYVVENKKARQAFVKTGPIRGDFIAILDGVKPGDEVVTAGAFKLRNGAGVTINNSVDAGVSLNPHPENH